jgi:Ran GTPase-activating protein (RanGAP) involved in mRNA processing and transport
MSCEIIKDFLKKNITLEKLLLKNNEIEKSGAKEIVEGFREHPKLHHLDISYNPITAQGLLHFVELFKADHRLTTLCAQSCDIKPTNNH